MLWLLWGVHGALAAAAAHCRRINHLPACPPACQPVQIRFSFDDEHPPSDLLGTLLPRRVSLDAAAAAAAAEAGVALPLSGGALAAAPVLASLRHLALVHPPRSVIPPTAHLPDALSTMTQARWC